MEISVKDHRLYGVREKVLAGMRLDAEDGAALYRSDDIIGIGRMANHVRQRRHGKKTYYVYNQHINYTNVCINRCRFCAFSRNEKDPDAYVMSVDDVKNALLKRIEEPVREIHMVGGLHPSLPFDYYLGLLKVIKEIRPNATIRAFTAVEINHIEKIPALP